MQIKTTCPPEICNASYNGPWCMAMCPVAKDKQTTHHKVLAEQKAQERERIKAGIIAKKDSNYAGAKPREVVCLTTKKSYLSARIAAEDIKATPEAIMAACAGRTKTCKNMKWAYVGVDKKEKIQVERYKRKQVRYIPSGKTYESAVEAAEDTGWSVGTVYTHVGRKSNTGKERAQLFEYTGEKL